MVPSAEPRLLCKDVLMPPDTQNNTMSSSCLLMSKFKSDLERQPPTPNSRADLSTLPGIH